MIQATLHQLKVFETVARHGSFTRAAEELSITQPTVSSQIKQLTKAVGLPLFEHIGKSLYITEAGHELLSTCKDVFERFNNFEMAIADLKGAKQGKLNISAITTAKYFLPRLLGSFCQQYPGIDVALNIVNHQQISERMEANKDDLYIVSEPSSGINLTSQPFLPNPLLVVANQDHPLASQKNIPIAHLDGEAFIMREQGSGTRAAVEQLFEQQGVSVKVKLELGSNEAIKSAIAGGLGISVLSKHCLTSEAISSQLTVLNVEHFPIERRWFVSYLSDKQLSVIATAFLEFLLQKTSKIESPFLNSLVQV